MSTRSFAILLLVLSGCASSPYPSVDEPMPPPEPGANAPGQLLAAAAPSGPSKPIAAGTLARADVERVVDAGLGRFLTHVAIEPSLSAGRFQGWSIVELVPAEAWRDVDLRPGDVVTRVNGKAIEREMQAFEVFQAVRGAPTLEVSYLRQNQPRTLRFTIVGAPSPSLPKAQPASNPG